MRNNDVVRDSDRSIARKVSSSSEARDLMSATDRQMRRIRRRVKGWVRDDGARQPVSNNRQGMGDKVNGVVANVVGWLAIVVMLRPRHAVDFGELNKPVAD